jgi:alpha-beta hydrolase superfamily lysophospholipase
MRSVLHGVLAIASSMTTTSCIGLDGFLFTGQRLDHYTLAYSDAFPSSFRVPEALREVQSVTASDGTVTWLVFARQEGAAMATAPTIVYSHGQSANIDRYWERVSILWSQGANVVAYDYPGYGMTPGHTTEAGVYATAQAATDFVRSLGSQIDQRRVFQYGFSMGTGAATQMAAFGPVVHGLILEAPFTSINALVADGAIVAPRSFVLTASFDNLAKIVRAAQRTDLGVLIFHGTDDNYVQTKYGQQLDQAMADAETTGALMPMRHRLVLIEGADHSEIPCPAGDNPTCQPDAPTAAYYTNLREFLAR